LGQNDTVPAVPVPVPAPVPQHWLKICNTSPPRITTLLLGKLSKGGRDNSKCVGIKKGKLKQKGSILCKCAMKAKGG
jgi:hypothetical protein